MKTKHFGDIFRPYADWIGDLATNIDNLLSSDPVFARFVTPLLARDFLLIYGEKYAVLAISRRMHKHYPLRQAIKWPEDNKYSEDVFVTKYIGNHNELMPVDDPQLTQHLENNENFSEPFVIVFPAIFIAAKTDEKYEIRSNCIEKAATLFLETEKKYHTEHLEMEKPKDIFLSHKSIDKDIVREISKTLNTVGYSPWLDEDRMKAGAHLERSLREGFSDSCAAVFFITTNFRDEGYLASEIDYAIAEKREKNEKFTIITLLIRDAENKVGEVPKMLKSYVYKEVKEIEIIRSIVEALPIKLNNVGWRV